MQRSTYHPLSILWHWLVAAFIATAFALALLQDEGAVFTPERLRLLNWHKWVGILVLFTTALRLITRLIAPPPPLPPTVLAQMPRWQQYAHRAVLLLLLLLCLTVPMGGWLMSSAKGYPVVLFGLWQLPDLIAPNPELGKVMAGLHELGGWTLAVLIGVHFAASCKHYFLNRDGVVGRMIPFLKR